MKQIELHLSESDRVTLNAFRSKGVHPAREVSRAHVLLVLDSGVADATICQVMGLGRTALWRTRAAYRQGGLEYALHDEGRPGQPRKYQTDEETEVVALACSAPPGGRKRWKWNDARATTDAWTDANPEVRARGPSGAAYALLHFGGQKGGEHVRDGHWQVDARRPATGPCGIRAGSLTADDPNS